MKTADDDVDEENETFTVGLAVSGTTETVTATDEATGTIVDDDGVPDAPTGLKITYNEASDGTAASGNIKVTWDDPRPSQHGSSLITSYEVSAKATNLPTRMVSVPFTDRADGAVFEAANLTVGATYTIEVVAKSAAGDSDARTVMATPLPIVTIASSASSLDESAVATTATLSASIPAAMTTDLMIDVSVDENAADVKLSAMRLTILAGETATAADATDDADDNITITVVDDDEDEGNTARASLSDPAVATEIAYDVVKITGTYGPDNRATAPEDGVEIEIVDDDAAPAAPTSVTLDNITASGFRINWAEPTSNPAVTGYEYRVKDAGSGGTGTFADTDSWKPAGNADARALTVTGLKAETNYIVEVRAVNSVGEGETATPAVATGDNTPDGTAHVKTSAS